MTCQCPQLCRHNRAYVCQPIMPMCASVRTAECYLLLKWVHVLNPAVWEHPVAAWLQLELGAQLGRQGKALVVPCSCIVLTVVH